jgi:hypothetical protein
MALSRRGIELTGLPASFHAAKWELFAVAKKLTKENGGPDGPPLYPT